MKAKLGLLSSLLYLISGVTELRAFKARQGPEQVIQLLVTRTLLGFEPASPNVFGGMQSNESLLIHL